MDGKNQTHHEHGPLVSAARFFFGNINSVTMFLAMQNDDQIFKACLYFQIHVIKIYQVSSLLPRTLRNLVLV